MYVMNDLGLDGDKTSGDNIWSAAITFPQGTLSGGFVYKYGAYYPGCENISSTKPMDNEGNAGQDHAGIIRQVQETIEFNDIWAVYIILTDVRQISDIIPQEFSLAQNYPNPFNPSTTIKFELNKASKVNLSIFNLLGEKIATIINDHKPAGTYEVNFTANNLASGLYFYTLTTPNFAATRKMVLIK